MAVDREGFLSLRSLSYIGKVLSGERSIERDSVSHKTLQREVRAALADFARLTMVEDLNLLLLWLSGPSISASDVPVEDMNTQQFQEWLATRGLKRILRLYDDALDTDFEEDFNNRMVELVEIAEEKLDEDEEDDTSAPT